MIAVRTLTPPPVCEREILRYAGCREADEGVRALLAECLNEALPVLSYTVCFREIDPAPFTARSAQLTRHLDGCERVVLMAATLGLGMDRYKFRTVAQIQEKEVLERKKQNRQLRQSRFSKMRTETL